MTPTRARCLVAVLSLAAVGAAPLPSSTARAEQDPLQDRGPGADRAEAPAALVLGKTTLPQAEAYWRLHGARPLARGNLAIGSGSGADGMAKLALEQVVLVDVDGVDFEGFSAARYGFVEGVLYSIQVTLGMNLSKKKAASANELSKDELQALEARLRKEHGKPTRELRDLTAGKKPNVLVWTKGPDDLTLAISLHRVLRLEHQPLAKKVAALRKAECKKRGPNVCW